MGKRGQVTIFIIIAIIIIVIGILIYAFYPQIQSIINPTSKNPSAFLQSCLEDEIEETIEILSLQGGSMAPEGYYLYKGNKLKYLCYTNQDYQLCGLQISFLENHIESEIKNAILDKVNSCLEELKETFEEERYSVNIEEGDIVVELLPERVITTLTHKLTLTKGDTARYDGFKIILESDLYRLLGITESILEWESNYGEAEPLLYMGVYHDLDIEKLKQTDDTKVYILTNINTKDKFQFASRSLPFPPGY